MVSPRHADARPYHERWRSLDGKVEFGREYRGEKKDSYVGQSYSGRSSGEKNGDSPVSIQLLEKMVLGLVLANFYHHSFRNATNRI